LNRLGYSGGGTGACMLAARFWVLRSYTFSTRPSFLLRYYALMTYWEVVPSHVTFRFI